MNSRRNPVPVVYISTDLFSTNVELIAIVEQLRYCIEHRQPALIPIDYLDLLLSSVVKNIVTDFGDLVVVSSQTYGYDFIDVI